MKGTLFTADFAIDSNDNARLLELNTDTGFYTSVLSHLDYSGLIDIISSSNITDFHVIRKNFHEEFSDHLSASLAASSSITTFSESVEEQFTLYPSVIADADDKFILRLAYDESTIFDSIYCKSNNEVFQLFHDNSDTGSVAEVYISQSNFTYDTLRREVNGALAPDFVAKRHQSGVEKVGFYKLVGTGSQAENIASLVDNLDPSVFLVNYYNDATQTTHTSYRSYNITYGSDLDVLNLANLEVEAILDKPTDTLVVDENGNVDDKHFYEFANNYPSFHSADGFGGIYEDQLISSASGDPVSVVSASVGQEFKSYFVSGSPDTDLVSVFTNWSHPGSTPPSGSYTTSSILTNSVRSTLNKNLVSHLIISGGDSIKLSGNQHLLVYDSVTDELTYKVAYKIDEATDQFLGVNNNLIPITYNRLDIMNQKGYSYLLDLEEVDTYMIHGTLVNVKVVAHNACFPANTRIRLANGESKYIQDIKAGDEITSFDIETREFVNGKVDALNESITEEGLIKIHTETKESIKATKGHKIYTPEGWRAASDLRVGDTVVNFHSEETTIASIEEMPGTFKVYHLVNVGSKQTYFANDVLVHNYSSACFIAGTEISLANGDIKYIEDVQVGDEVVTYNEETGENESKSVYELITPLHNDLVTYTLEDGSKVTSTYDHPYYVDGLELKSHEPEKTNELYDIDKVVTKIAEGDILYKEDGTKSAIVSIDAELKDEDVQTYIIRVEDNFNFYANGILVHNK